MSLTIAGLTEVKLESMLRVHLRLRGANVNTSGWRMELSATQGRAAITVAEQSGQSFYRAEGALLGWPQPALAEVWSKVTAASSEGEHPDAGPQLG